MIREYKDKEKYKDGLFITNYLTKIINNKKKRQYTKKQIDGLILKFKEKDIDNIIKYLFDNKISLKESVAVNYRQIQLIYEKTKDIDTINKFEQYNLLSKELSKILKNIDFTINYLKNIYKNQSRAKGNLFKELFVSLIESKEIGCLIDNVNIEFDINIIKTYNNNEDFIYIPENDENTKRILNHFNIKFENEKGRDCLIRLNGFYYLIEAKEIGEEGGSQNNQFKDMLSCISETNKDNKLIGIGVLYGACLFYNNKYQKEVDLNDNIIPLSEFIYNLKNSLIKL